MPDCLSLLNKPPFRTSWVSKSLKKKKKNIVPQNCSIPGPTEQFSPTIETIWTACDLVPTHPSLISAVIWLPCTLPKLDSFNKGVISYWRRKGRTFIFHLSLKLKMARMKHQFILAVVHFGKVPQIPFLLNTMPFLPATLYPFADSL